MKKLLILLFVLPFLFACTDTSSSPTPEKKAEKPAPEKPEPKPACESNNDCPNGKICKDGMCQEDPTHVISCGDGIVEGNEECDDGANNGNGHCTSACQLK